MSEKNYIEDSVDDEMQVSARKSSNLAFAFFCMDKGRARDMEIFYTYCRILDDIADDTSTTDEFKVKSLDRWEAEIEKIYSGLELGKGIVSELRGVIERRSIPKEYMLAIIGGVRRDTEKRVFEDFEDIKGYCYGVASAVGIVSVHIFGYKDARTLEFAKSLGYAFQFTNILRDVVYDKRKMDRVYIPKKEMEFFGVSGDDLRDGTNEESCKRLYKMMYFRAKHFFNRARLELVEEDIESLTPAFIMWSIYEEILEEIRKGGFKIKEKVVKISKIRKIYLAIKVLARKRFGRPMVRGGGGAKRVSVFGGGIAGISAAINISLAGHDVDLYEMRSGVGGRACSFFWKPCGAYIDNGSHALMGRYKEFFRITEILGTRDRFTSPVKDIMFYSPDGKRFAVEFPVEESHSINIVKKFFSLPKVKGFGTLRNIFLLLRMKMGLARAKVNESAREYLDRMGINETARNIFWEPFCVSVQNSSLDIADANIFRTSVQESLLKGVKASALIFAKGTISDALFPISKVYLEGVGGSIHLSKKVSKVNFEGGKFVSFELDSGDKVFSDVAVSALPYSSVENLIPDCEAKKKMFRIKDSAILNIHFTTRKKLFDCEFVALIDSSLHWVFDHSKRLNGGDKYLYGITVSSYNGSPAYSRLDEYIKYELEKYFGEFEIVDFLPTVFKNATMLSDNEGEQCRVGAKDVCENFILVGDWIQTGLPCTIESASKSARVEGMI